ncbi:MAG: ADP-ribosylglycohydrolase family protein, partial [Actinobacteria bacterium]|nr:ADP-ribosylglycohydrolase family protein [Actinomycetota bacterium]
MNLAEAQTITWKLTEVLRQARLSAAITHDHPEGIKGAQATALAVYLARTGADKATLRSRIQ